MSSSPLWSPLFGHPHSVFAWWFLLHRWSSWWWWFPGTHPVDISFEKRSMWMTNHRSNAMEFRIALVKSSKFQLTSSCEGGAASLLLPSLFVLNISAGGCWKSRLNINPAGEGAVAAEGDGTMSLLCSAAGVSSVVVVMPLFSLDFLAKRLKSLPPYPSSSTTVDAGTLPFRFLPSNTVVIVSPICFAPGNPLFSASSNMLESISCLNMVENAPCMMLFMAFSIASKSASNWLSGLLLDGGCFDIFVRSKLENPGNEENICSRLSFKVTAIRSSGLHWRLVLGNVTDTVGLLCMQMIWWDCTTFKRLPRPSSLIKDISGSTIIAWSAHPKSISDSLKRTMIVITKDSTAVDDISVLLSHLGPIPFEAI